MDYDKNQLCCGLLKSVVLCQQLYDRLYPFAKLCVIMSHTLILNAGACGKKQLFFGQDVFNTHGFECTHIHIRISF